MKYALLIYEDQAAYGEPAAGKEIHGRHMDFIGDNPAVLRGGAGLKGAGSATTVRTAGGAQTLHDGPFAEAKEQLAGFYLVEVADLDAAIALARKVPLHRDGAIEVRPLSESM